jgi:hypothetical protein
MAVAGDQEWSLRLRPQKVLTASPTFGYLLLENLQWFHSHDQWVQDENGQFFPGVGFSDVKQSIFSMLNLNAWKICLDLSSRDPMFTPSRATCLSFFRSSLLEPAKPR